MSSDSTVIPRDTNSGWAAERARRGGRQRHSKWWLLAVIVSVTLSLPLSGYLAPAAASQGADLAGFYPESQISYQWSSLREGPSRSSPYWPSPGRYSSFSRSICSPAR